MVKVICKRYDMIKRSEAEITSSPLFKANLEPNLYKHPFYALLVIKAYRSHIEPLSTPKLVPEVVELIISIPKVQDTVIYEGTNYKAAIGFYKEAKALGYPCVIEGLTEAVEVLYGRNQD